MARMTVDTTPQERASKSKVLSIAVAFLFFILMLRVFYITIINGEKNLSLSINNRVFLETIKASRGIIYDRNGIVLARNRPSYSVKVLPYHIPKDVDIAEKLLKIRSRDGTPLFDTTELEKKLRYAKYRSSRLTTLKEDISLDYVSIIREHSLELPGIELTVEPRREYPLGEDTYHVLGYLGEIPRDKMDSLKSHGYQQGDLIGKAGIEQQYEYLLHGEDGIRYIEKNVYGRRLGVVNEMPQVEPERGKNIYLTIDAELQQVANQSFPDSVKGAAVAMDPRNGEVLAMVSKPSFNPNIFSLDPKKRAKEWRKIALDPNRPLTNRAVNGVYPPGSTFKLVSGLSFIDSEHYAPHDKMPQGCNGSYKIGRRIARCWNPHGHGRMDLYDALKVSCNVYFYQGSRIVQDKTINDYATKFGLGVKTGIDLPHEKVGWLSGEEAYNERFKNKKPKPWVWTEGLVLDLSIGQAQVFTPIQLGVMTSAMGNGKERFVPFLLKEIRSGDGAVLEQINVVDSTDLNVKDESIAAVKEGMRRVVMDPGGTGRRSRVPGLVVGGKSGSSENPHGEKTHALFVAAAPLDDPVIAVAVVVENAGHGGAVAAPIAGDMLRYYFENTSEGQKVLAQYTQEVE